MNLSRNLVITLPFIDEYCMFYQNFFPEVRSFEYFKCLHLGMISKLPRKSLPAISHSLGMKNSQPLHHFLTNSPWDVEAIRKQRIELLKQAIKGREFILCIENTGDKKKGNNTDYVAKQYVNNIGNTENSIVCINAYGILETITFPLIFKVFKPISRLKEKDIYKTKPQLVIEIINELLLMGFKFQIVFVDSLYGESSDFIEVFNHYKLKFVVAIRNDHKILMMPSEISYNKWKVFAHEDSKALYTREVLFSKKRSIKYWQISKDTINLPKHSTWFIMTNLSGDIQKSLSNIYGLRTWLEYGFKQSQDELGWADYRLTEFSAIEKWWEIVCSVSLMLALQSSFFKDSFSNDKDTNILLNSNLNYKQSSLASVMR